MLPCKLIVRRLCLIITFAVFLLQASGQNAETDSLKRRLAGPLLDTTRVYVLESLSYAYLSSYPDSALQFALDGMKLAEQINFLKGEAICTNALGNVYFSVGDYPNALQMYLKYLS